jgi:hypothetical protein
MKELRPSEVRISCARAVVHYRARAPDIVGIRVTVTVAKRQIYLFNVSDALLLVLRSAPTPTAPSVLNGSEHHRPGSPNPLPVPPRHRNDSYREDRTRRTEPNRHHSHRRHDHDSGHGHVHDGEVRVRDSAYQSESLWLIFGVLITCSRPSRHTFQGKCRMNISRMLSLDTETRLNTLISSFQGVLGAKRLCV